MKTCKNGLCILKSCRNRRWLCYAKSWNKRYSWKWYSADLTLYYWDMMTQYWYNMSLWTGLLGPCILLDKIIAMQLWYGCILEKLCRRARLRIKEQCSDICFYFFLGKCLFWAQKNNIKQGQSNKKGQIWPRMRLNIVLLRFPFLKRTKTCLKQIFAELSLKF